MKQNKKIALTGGIGSGKSAALGILRAHGCAAFSCDEIYCGLCEEPLFTAGLASLFPFAVKDGKLDRTALANAVFSDEEARKKLNAYTHPRIMERLFSLMEPYPLSFAEVPLLFEEGYGAAFDEIIVLMRDKAARIEALKGRSGLSEQEIAARMESQFGYDAIPEGCHILQNDGSLADLEAKLVALLRDFTENI